MTNKRRWPLTLLTGVLLVIALAIVFIPSEWYPASLREWAVEVTAPAGEEETGAEADVPFLVEQEHLSVTFEKDDGEHVRESGLIYQKSQYPDIVCMYLTVFPGNAGENTNHTWEDINTYSVYDYNSMGVPRYQVSALLQVGDDKGPLEGELGYDQEIPNATVQVRGQTSSRSTQKNYKIELKKGKGTWNDQRTIALNKHQQDGIRFRNKLAYDLLAEIPQLMGLRTQFVRLFVKDLTSETPTEFVDYGIYTQIEQLNSTSLTAHGLSKFGDLYKINFFEFFRYEDVIKTTFDPTYNEAAMEYLIENKNGSDNTKLIQMLDAVNDLSIPIDTLLDKYFDRENIQYWLAFEILIANADTQSRNVYIYSPPNSNKWYFYPWDHDAAFMRYERELRGREDGKDWQVGISNYWGNRLFQRCLLDTKFRQELDEVIRGLKDTVLSRENVAQKAEHLRSVVEPYLYTGRDEQRMKLSPEEYDYIASRIPDEIQLSYDLYLESLEKPMPFYIDVPYMENGKLVYEWQPAYDLDDETVRYEFELSNTANFTDYIYHEKDRLIPVLELDPLPPGQYFIRLTATNASGYSQHAIDYYRVTNGNAWGVKSFYVLEDGRILEDVYVEK